MSSRPSSIAADDVRAYVAHVDLFARDAHALARAIAWMTPAELVRFNRFRHDQDRWMFALGRSMARTLVGRELGVAPYDWRWREGPHGRPEIAAPHTDLHFNVSHSAGLVVCALGRGRELGVDLENLERHPPDPALVPRYCSTSEAADIAAQGDRWRERFLVYWTLKEAYLKARGLGISVQLADISFALHGDHEASIAFDNSLAGTDDRWRFHLQRHAPHHLIAVAASCAANGTPRVSVVPYLMTPRLFATSDIHISHRANHAALATMGRYPDDWLVLAGDVGERAVHLHQALDELQPRFARVIWTPGNHDLWCPAGATDRTRGLARYEELVAICRQRDVLTPEDPYVEFPAAPGTFIIPMFLLFDYSFRPPDVHAADARDWARAEAVLSGDEWMIDPAPFASIPDWCADRCATTAARLEALPPTASTVLVNHWPLRYDLARPPRVPRFSIWCGTTRTEEWATRYRAAAVVSGHLHLRTTLWRDGVRYEEVSLGYPRDWNQARGIDWYLRDILPGASAAATRFIPYRDPYL